MRKIRYGMAGGGEGAFIGAAHRAAAALDGRYELVCGAFSSDAERGRRSAASLGLSTSRAYENVAALIAGESALSAEQRIEVLVIATPNYLHAPAASAALRAGFHVICDKPAAMNLAEASALADVVYQSNRIYALTYTYAGYPMVEEARYRVARGDLGAIRRIDVAYRQGWLSTPIEQSGQKQASWRTDPEQAGSSCCLADIGVHAFQLAEHVGGMPVQALSADVATHVAGRRLDDDAAALLRFANGARGTLVASQICCGEENGLAIRVYGERGGLEWLQTEPDSLLLKWPERPMETVRMGGPQLSPQALARCRVPAGHPGGYLEAFANHYRAVAEVLAVDTLAAPLGDPNWFPGIAEGLRSMAFVEAALRNSRGNEKWSELMP
jgi:predicted dehydrogenase